MGIGSVAYGHIPSCSHYEKQCHDLNPGIRDSRNSQLLQDQACQGDPVYSVNGRCRLPHRA